MDIDSKNDIGFWRWTALATAIMASVYFLLAIVVPLTMLLAGASFDGDSTHIVAMSLGQHAVFIAVIAGVLSIPGFGGRTWLPALRARNWRWLYFPESLVAELVLLPAMGLAMYISSRLFEIWGLQGGEQLVVGIMLSCGWLEFAAMAFMAVVLAPVTEEIIFRRIFFEFFRRPLGVAAAMLLSSILFAAVHYSPLQFLSLLTLGLAFQALYLIHRSLYPCVLLHALHNATAISLILAARIWPSWESIIRQGAG